MSDYNRNADHDLVYRRRVSLAASCQDADSIPKVAGAGETFGVNGGFQRMHNGIIVHSGAYHGAWMTELIRRLRGHHEPQEEKVFAAVLEAMPDTATMVEFGSFWAYYSMWFHLRVARPQCILIEPNTAKLAVGRSHFALNKMNGEFLPGFAGRKSSPVETFEDWDGTQQALPMYSVDGLMQEFSLSRLNILHADVQGAETEMLLGAENALREHRIDFLFVSTHGCEHRPCLTLLERHDYEIVASHSVLESFSGDGLIVATGLPKASFHAVPISKRRPTIPELIRYHLACFRRRFVSRSII